MICHNVFSLEDSILQFKDRGRKVKKTQLRNGSNWIIIIKNALGKIPNSPLSSRVEGCGAGAEDSTVQQIPSFLRPLPEKSRREKAHKKEKKRVSRKNERFLLFHKRVRQSKGARRASVAGI
jgi:hypothetical protein